MDSYDRYSALHVLVLWNFAVAQPLYDLFSRNGEFFIAHRASAADLTLFILVLSLLVPGVLVAAELAAGLLHVRFRYLVHLGLAYAKVGQPEKARVTLNQALKLKADVEGAAEARAVLASLLQ